MTQALDFVERNGTSLVFAVVFLDQLGVPIPTPPMLLAFGALAGNGKIDPVAALVLAVVASLCADFLWFQLGRWKGNGVLGFLCKAALEPDSCVSKTRDLFARYGVKSLLVAKFVPGFDTVAPPLAGMLGVDAKRFLLWSGAGAFLWLAVYGGLGYLFSEDIEDLARAADGFGGTLGLLVLGVVAAYVAWKLFQRQRVLRNIRMTRITPQDLHQMILSGQEPFVIDARSRSALDSEPFVIQGARPITLEEIDVRQAEIPRERDIIVYCS